jgi:hypothetical protein
MALVKRQSASFTEAAIKEALKKARARQQCLLQKLTIDISKRKVGK